MAVRNNATEKSKPRRFKFPVPGGTTNLKSILNTRLKGNISTPVAATAMNAVSKRNLQVAETKWAKKGIDMWKKYIAVDVAASPSRPGSMRNCLPCLTQARTAHAKTRAFISGLKRNLTIQECMRAQGLDPAVVRWRESLSEKQLGEALGNAITQTVLQEIIKNVLPCIN